MRAYKGLHKDSDGTLFCKDKIYEPGKTYKYDGEIELCESGFHACKELWQAWVFYPNNGNNVFYEVECGGDIIESEEGDGKFVCSEITLIKEVDVSDVARFDYMGFCHEGFAWVMFNRKWNFIDIEGRILSGQWFDFVYNFHEGFARVEINDKGCNFIGTDGKFLSEQWFDFVENFSEGFAVVKLNRKWNFIGKNGKFLSEQWFNNAHSFNEGIAAVKLNGRWIKIDKNGNL